MNLCASLLLTENSSFFRIREVARLSDQRLWLLTCVRNVFSLESDSESF